MMSLTKIGIGELVKKQYFFKLRAYSGIFTTLIVLQAIGIFFSVLGGDSSGTASSKIELTVTSYSSEQVIIFTMIWIFISAILITTKAYREDDFTFVSNRMSNNLANGLVLLTASLLGGVTSYLSGFLIKIITRFFDHNFLALTGLPSTKTELISGVSSIILIMVLLSSIGYLVGTIIQVSNVFIVILPALFVGFLFLADNVGNSNIAFQVFEFYFNEPSILLFTMKMVVTSVLLYIGASIISNRQEVRL